jgi:hypothetical protein
MGHGKVGMEKTSGRASNTPPPTFHYSYTGNSWMVSLPGEKRRFLPVIMEPVALLVGFSTLLLREQRGASLPYLESHFVAAPP